MAKPVEAFGGRTWDELEVLEHDAGQLMFPAVLRRRDPKGAVVQTKVRVRVPSPEDTFRARAAARKWAGELELDPKEDVDLFKQLEQLCLLARSVRTFDSHAQFAEPAELGKYDESCLHDLQEQIAAFKEQLDPRDSVETEEQVWRKAVEIQKAANIGPLVDTAGRDQQPFVLRMVEEALRSPTGLSWLRSFGISIPEPSPSPSSAPS
jgi:hypothetical protein